MPVRWWAVPLALALAGLLVPAGPLALVIYGMAVAGLVALWAVRGAARALFFSQRVAPTHLPPGETVHVALTVANCSRLPVPWLWWRQALPVQLEAESAFEGAGAVAAGGHATFQFAFRPRRRGRYRIGRVEYRHGDWFGLHAEQGQAVLPLWVTVYPAVLPFPRLPVRPLVPTGPRRDPSSPFREELAIGVRDYLNGDPLRYIAWKATARQGRLQVREFPRVRARSLSLVVDLELSHWQGRAARRHVERLLSLAASYLWAPPDGDHPVGLLTFAASVRYVPEGTGLDEEPPRLVRVTPRTGLAHRRRLLEILACLQPGAGPGLASLLLAQESLLGFGEGVLILTGRYHAEVWAAAALLAARHHPVSLAALDEGALPPCRGVPVYGVNLEGAIRWR